MNVSLSTDLDDSSAIPYSFWDEPMTVSEFRHRLKTASTEEQTRLLAKMLREARDTDVWKFISPEEVWRRLPDVSAQLGRRRKFWQFILERWHQEGFTVLVDLVRDRVKQIVPEKPVTHGIRIDSPEEILANKLCALLSRSEIRDLVDVRALEMAGYRVEDALAAAHLKDTGLTPAQLSWVLGEIRMGDDLVPPGEVSAKELREYLGHLIGRLARLAFPR